MTAGVSNFEEWRSKRPEAINVVDQTICSCHGNNVICIHTVSSPWVLPLASLRSEEVNAWSYLSLLERYVVVMERSRCHGHEVRNTHAYQTSSPSVLALASLRRSTWGYLLLLKQYVVVMETCSCHGNDVICMCTLLLACLRSEEVILDICLVVVM